jgi:hypothetical protein
MGHIFVGARFRGRDVLEVDGVLVDVGLPSR